MKELPEKRKEFRLKFELRRLNNFRELEKSKRERRKGDLKNKQELRRLNSRRF